MIPGLAPTANQIALALLKGDPEGLKKADSPYGKPNVLGDDASAEEKWQAAKRLDDLKKEAAARGVDLKDPAAKQVLKRYDDLQAFAKLSPEDQQELEKAGVSMDKMVLAFKGALKAYVKAKQKEEGDSFDLERDPLVRMMKEEIRGLRIAEDDENKDRFLEALKEAKGDTEKARELFKPEEVAKTIEEAFRKVLDEARRDDTDGGPRDRLDLSPQARAMLGLPEKHTDGREEDAGAAA
ncbi:hypothetical protein [Caenispirillum salinarum]|uniref:hypothetical protein n=1 Tax=Caenispirillum salinarum TaxID=859058 RepID=UPI00384BF3C6